MATELLPVVCFPDGRPVPFLLTRDELLKFLRVDEDELRFPEKRIETMRKNGLRAVQCGRRVLFKLDDVLRFLQQEQERNPR